METAPVGTLALTLALTGILSALAALLWAWWRRRVELASIRRMWGANA